MSGKRVEGSIAILYSAKQGYLGQRYVKKYKNTFAKSDLQ